MEDLKKIQEFFSKPLEENVDKKYSDFLVALRDSGVTNMFGAAPYLQAEFGLDKREAREVLANWMRSFGESLEEGKQLDIEDFAKVVQAVTKTGHPVTVLLTPKFNEIEIITGMNAPDDILFDLSNAVDSLGYGRNDIIIAADSSNLSRREYSDIRRVNGGHKDYFEESLSDPRIGDSKFGPSPREFAELRAQMGDEALLDKIQMINVNTLSELLDELDLVQESVNETDLNDPVAMKMRAAKDKLAKMRAANAGDDGNDKFFDAAKLRALKKKRAQIMRDMEQEAELEGGPVADKYGDMLNKLDKAISMLKEYDESMPSQEEVDQFFQDNITLGTHYLNRKPVMGQKGSFNKTEIAPWDEADYSNWKTLVAKSLKEEEGYSQFLKTDDNPEGKTKGLDTKTMNKILMNVIKDLDELKQLGEGVIEEELCAKGKAYIKKRQAAGEKSSAYLSGRAVKVCKGQMKG